MTSLLSSEMKHRFALFLGELDIENEVGCPKFSKYENLMPNSPRKKTAPRQLSTCSGYKKKHKTHFASAKFRHMT